MSEVQARDFVPLHLTTREEENSAAGFDIVGRQSRVATPRFRKSTGLPSMSVERTVLGEDGLTYLVLRLSEAVAVESPDGDQRQVAQVVMAPSLRVLADPSPTYVVELACVLQPIGAADLKFEALDAFQKVTVRLRPRGGGALPAEPSPTLLGKTIQLAVSLPSPVIDIPHATIVRTVDAKGRSDGYLAKLVTPLQGPRVGPWSWRTGHIVLLPRDGDRLEHVFHPGFLGIVHVNVFRPISEEKVVRGAADPDNLVPIAVAQALPQGSAPPGSVDGALLFGVTGGLPEPTLLDEPIDELRPGATPLGIKLPAGTQVLVVPRGTPTEEVERKMGKKMKLYGDDPRGGGRWMYIARDDDRRILSETAKGYWDDYRTLAQIAGIALDDQYYREAEILLSRILELKPGNYMARCSYAGALAGTGKIADGERILLQVVGERPSMAYPLRLLSQIYSKRGDMARTIEYARKAALAEPEEWLALNMLFLTYEEHGREREGLWELQDLAARYIMSHGPLEFLSSHFESKGQIDLGIEFARGAFERRQNDDTFSALTGRLGKAGRIDAVIGLASTFRDAPWFGYKSLGNLATAYKEASQLPLALETVNKMLPLTPPSDLGGAVGLREEILAAMKLQSGSSGRGGLFRRKA